MNNMNPASQKGILIQATRKAGLNSFGGVNVALLKTPREMSGYLKIKLTADQGSICLGCRELAKEKEGTRWHVKGPIVVAQGSPTPYLNARFYDDHGFFFDGAYQRGVQDTISFDGDLQIINGHKMISFSFNNATPGEIIYFSSMGISSDALDPIHGHFGGTVLWMPMKHYSQMESFLLRSAEGKLICIDGGETADAPELYEQIKKWGGVVDGWYFSHYHCDHVDAFLELMNNEKYRDLKIDRLYFDFRVSAEILSKYGDADNHCIADVEAAVAKAGPRIKEVIIPRRGDLQVYSKTLSIETLNDAKFLPHPNMPNDSSIVYKAITPKENILFLGDVGAYGDELIEDPWFKKKISDCSFVQLAHHGQNGASQAFYKECAGMKVALTEAPRWLFDCNIDNKGCGSGPWSSLTTRKWLRALGVRYYFDQEEDVIFD